uniref:VWFA domain-containing protein n=1 Tax=Angiostrongylus cantonensis TaxID=6313 RepID=A0A158P8Y0_ANGCA
MAENKRADETMRHQFIGTYSGVTRMYPRRYWRVEPSPITIDLFDPKFRPWFVNTESAPKDILFLIDYSGSVKGPTMHLIKITLMYILSTLSPNDYFFGVYFNSVFSPILNCSGGTFLPATTSNKKVIFFERLGEIEEKDQAHVSPPLKFSLDALRGNLNSSDSVFTNYRSGGHKILMIFTDGLDEWPHAVMDEELRNRDGDVIRMFGFSMGYGTGQLPLLHWMACNTFAKYSVIDSIMDVKPQSRSFLDHLSIALGRSLESTPIEARRISWTTLYMETQGLGPTITISLPIVSKPDGIWLDQRIAGIAGIDIGLAELTEKLPKEEQLYGIIVDSNGIIVYHPKLIIPVTEVHSVRRSACYDASHVRHRAGSGLRVQYGFSDERVYRLVGLIDSIPTIDLVSSNFRKIVRRKMMRTKGNCREFYCANLHGSPFSVVIVNSSNRQTLTYTEKLTTIDTTNNPFVSYHLSSRSICNWKLDSLPSTSRFDALRSVDCGEDLNLPYALANALRSWTDSWPQYDNISRFSCEDLPLPSGFAARYFVNSFVHTRSQIEAYFPSCSKSYMKEIATKFNAERVIKDNSAEMLQFSVRNDIIIAYRSITDQYHNRLAVVGVQWRMPYLNALFMNWTRSTKQWSDCKKMDCLLITRSGFVLASSTSRNPAPLARFDPQLFDSLEENGLVATSSWVDAQAECTATRSAPWSSPAAYRVNPLQAIINSIATIIGKTFWIDLYYLMTSFVTAQPSMSGGLCRFQRIKPVERCFIRLTNYKMTLNISKQIQLSDMTCARYARVFPVPHTTLTVIRVDRACPGYRARRKYPPQSQTLEGCEKVTYFEKRPPPSYNTTVDENEVTRFSMPHAVYSQQ